MIRKAQFQDAPLLGQLAAQLWPDNDAGEMTREFEALLPDAQCALYLAYQGDQPIGFAQCQLRHDYVEGTDSSPVGYLEGIFVHPNCRGRGYARALVAACESWAREMGCTEFASDCQLANQDSLAFHRKVGFAEAGRIICFTKKL